MNRDLLSEPAFLVGIALGILIGWITLWCFLNPLVGRIVARLGAVAAIAFGVNWLVTPISNRLAGVSNPHYHSAMGDGDFGVALGWGAGGFVFGIAALTLSFLRVREGARPLNEKQSPLERKAEG
jgi:hypothetical protein